MCSDTMAISLGHQPALRIREDVKFPPGNVMDVAGECLRCAPVARTHDARSWPKARMDKSISGLKGHSDCDRGVLTPSNAVARLQSNDNTQSASSIVSRSAIA